MSRPVGGREKVAAVLVTGRVGMDRQQREAELRMMLTTQRGKEEILSLLKKHAGLEGEGNLPPFGTLLVEAILNYEYPPEEAPGSAPEPTTPTEPGDQKFAAPPAQESEGG